MNLENKKIVINKGKIKQTIMIAVFVSLGSLIRVEMLMEGFIVGFSVAIFAIFLYSYNQLSPIYIGVMAGIFSPAFRMITTAITTNGEVNVLLICAPDMIFFFVYGIVVRFGQTIFKEHSRRKYFLSIILTADVIGNIMEILVRGAIYDRLILSGEVVIYLILIAIIRTGIIAIILIAMEAYGTLISQQEHEDEYRKLSVMASDMASELYIMQKNIGEIERVMKDAYTLTRELEEVNAPEYLKSRSLEIAKNAHEIKGDYVRAINTMREGFVDKYEEAKISIRDIGVIVKNDINSYLASKNLNIYFYSNIKTDFYVNNHFEVVTILRNLIYNSIEAIEDVNTKRSYYIGLDIYEKKGDYIISVRDNGPGIPKDIIGNIFLSRFSTKFSNETGNMYRGIGLVIVKDYIENEIGGKIEVSSVENKATEFVITIPKEQLLREEEDHEILHN
ncbi:MAG: ATP-binding protein [Anaerovoracaceae bacterium]